MDQTKNYERPIVEVKQFDELTEIIRCSQLDPAAADFFEGVQNEAWWK